MSEFNNGQNIIKIDPQQSVSVCVLASIYIASQIVKNIEINSNVISGTNLTMLENETEKIVGTEPVTNGKGEPIIEANGTPKIRIKNEGINLDDIKLKDFIKNNLNGYVPTADANLFLLGLQHEKILDAETYIIFLTRRLKEKLSEFEKEALYKNTYIFHFIVHSFCMALLKHNNKYYYINSHSDSISSESKGIICEYSNLDEFFTDFINSNVLHSITKDSINIIEDTKYIDRNILNKPPEELNDADRTNIIILTQLNAFNVDFVIYYSTFEKYKNDMTEYIIKQKYTVYDDSQLIFNKISSDNDIFKKQFKDWYLYHDGAGLGQDCLIISFLKCTIPIFSKIDRDSRYLTASHFRRNMLLDDTLPYKKLFTNGEINGEFVDNRIQNGFDTHNVLSEDIVIRLCKYFIINVLFVSLNKINAQGGQMNQFNPIRGSQIDFEPIDLEIISGNYYVINNSGDGHFDSISNNNNAIFEITWNDICILRNSTGNKTLLDMVTPDTPNSPLTHCDYKQEEIILYNSEPYIIYSISNYHENSRKCTTVDIFKKTDKIPNFQKYMEIYNQFDKTRDKKKAGPDAKKELTTWQQQNGIKIYVPIEHITKYVDNRPKQLLEQMVQLETKITDPQLLSYQKYLIEQHKKFFTIE
jgi:hypothetical protein